MMVLMREQSRTLFTSVMLKPVKNGFVYVLSFYITPTDKMTTYYMIQTWGNRFSRNLYETFEDACDAIEEEAKSHVGYVKPDFETTKLNREEDVHDWNDEIYYRNSVGEHFYIVMVKVVPKKPKQYVYQYWVENKICGLHTKSGKYASFDEACDALDMELSQLYEVDGKEPLQGNRLVIKTLLEKSSTATYAYYNDGGPTTDKYVLSRQEG